MKTIVLTILVTAKISSCFCQDLPDLKEYKSDIGFNTNFVFNSIFNSGGNGNPFDLMLKKQKTSNSALRFGTSLSLNNYNDLSFSPQNYSQFTSYNFSFSLGKEFQKQLNKRWIFYYGADIAPFVLFYKIQSYVQDSNTPNLDNYLTNSNSTNSFGLKVIPFLGIRFNIHERLYVATQTNLFLSLNRKVSTQKSIDNSNSSPGNYNYYSSQRIFNEGSVNISPASGIFFFYRF